MALEVDIRGMEIKEIQDKNIWESFLSECKEKTFLQSWNWGDFQERMGNKIWRFGIFNKENLVAVFLVSKITAKRGKFFLIQHGPVVKDSGLEEEVLRSLVEELKKIKNQEQVSFIRMNPLWERSKNNEELFQKLGFKEAPMHANAYEATWKLDLTSSEEELLLKMRKTTRYLIRQTLKNQDITIEKSENVDGINLYQKLNEEVAQRQKFVPFSFDYVKNEFEVFAKDNQAILFFGKYKGEIAAAALTIFWSGIGFYHQAASNSKYTKLSIPYLLQWEAIKEAKARGCNLYDFWGYVDPKENPHHPWAGPTLFKMGFGGGAHFYVKTQDYSLSKKYYLTYLFEKLRKTKRGL